MEVTLNENIFEKICFSEQSNENFLNVQFYTKQNLDKIHYKKINVKSEDASVLFLELVEGVEQIKLNPLYSKVDNDVVIGFQNKTKDITILTNNQIINGKIKIVYDKTKENFFNILAFKNKTEQKVNEIKKISIYAKIYAL